MIFIGIKSNGIKFNGIKKNDIKKLRMKKINLYNISTDLSILLNFFLLRCGGRQNSIKFYVHR